MGISAKGSKQLLGVLVCALGLLAYWAGSGAVLLWQRCSAGAVERWAVNASSLILLSPFWCLWARWPGWRLPLTVGEWASLGLIAVQGLFCAGLTGRCMRRGSRKKREGNHGAVEL